MKGSGCRGFVAHPDAQTDSGQSLQEEQPLPAVQIQEAVCQQQPRRHWGADDLCCVKRQSITDIHADKRLFFAGTPRVLLENLLA